MRMPTGDTKMPEPMMMPTMMATPWNSVICFLSPTCSGMASTLAALPLPMVAVSVLLVTLLLKRSFFFLSRTGLCQCCKSCSDVYLKVLHTQTNMLSNQRLQPPPHRFCMNLIYRCSSFHFYLNTGKVVMIWKLIKEFDSRETSGWVQSLTHNGHPSIW